MSSDLPTRIIWEALTSSHQDLALAHGLARRYPANIAPFAALADTSADAANDLFALLDPEESVYVLGEQPSHPGLACQAVVPCLQMVFPESAPFPPAPASLLMPEALNGDHAAEMLDLIAVAYPGYFRAETYRMGRYFGLRSVDGALVAMGGERLIAQPWREISALCSHPGHAGRGLGTILLCHLLRLHRAEGSRSWLWVTKSNHRAAELYIRLGFQIVAHSDLHRMTRIA
jgi:ribosomal protein S18 acetylase RimI-like enzyme